MIRLKLNLKYAKYALKRIAKLQIFYHHIHQRLSKIYDADNI